MSDTKNMSSNYNKSVGKKGFTLAEVLITLAIIGVVAAMTIPSVIVRTNQQEFKTGAKKAQSAITNALQLVEVQDGLTFTDGNDFINAFASKMNIIKIDEKEEDGTPAVFYTADGFRYHILGMGDWGMLFHVDVNGDKGPSTSIYDYKKADYGDNDDNLVNPEWPNIKLTDIFQMYFYDNGQTLIMPYVYNP